jgi:hypothetical protein
MVGSLDDAYGSRARMILNPGSATRKASYQIFYGGWTNAIPLQSNYVSSGFYNANGLVNALQYYFVSGNITSLRLTVTGIV